MRKRIALPVGAAIMGAFCAIAAYWESVRNEPSLSLARMTPEIGDGRPVRGWPGERIKFRYVVRNTARDPIRGVSVETSCNCHIIQQLPDVIPARGTAEFVVSFTVPAVGRRKFPVRLETAAPVGELPSDLCILEAKFDPPALVQIPHRIEIRAVDGNPLDHKLTIMAAEDDAMRPWLSGIEFPPDSGLKAELLSRKVVETAEDSTAVVCTYTYGLRGPGTLKDVEGIAVVKSYFPPSVKPDSVPFRLMVARNLAAFPPQLALDRTSDKPKTIQLLLRSGKPVGHVELRFDEMRLRVEQRSGSNGSVVLEVAPIHDDGADTFPADTDLEIAVPGTSPIVIPIQFTGTGQKRSEM